MLDTPQTEALYFAPPPASRHLHVVYAGLKRSKADGLIESVELQAVGLGRRIH